MEYMIAKEKAIKYIGISKKTEHEVYKKLKSLGVDSLTISKVIDSLKELEYIDDVDYVKAYVRQNVKMLKYSVFELKQKLLQKGVKISIIDSVFNSDLPSSYEKEVISKLSKTKLKDYDNNKKRAYLCRRGFSLDNAEEIYDEY